MKVICLALLGCALAQLPNDIDTDPNARNSTSGQGTDTANPGNNKGRMSGESGHNAASCPPHSQLVRPPYQDMRDCQCDSGYQAYEWPGWGCYEQSTTFQCPPNSVDRTLSPKSMNDCRCHTGFAAYNNTCVYAYVFHVHGRVWISGAEVQRTFDVAEENSFKTAMASAISADTSRFYEKSCPGNAGEMLNQTACESATDPLSGAPLGCTWIKANEVFDHEHTKTENDTIVVATIASTSNKDATCSIIAANAALQYAEQVTAEDVLPYSFKNVSDVNADINVAQSDGRIVLAESDTDARNARKAAYDEKAVATDMAAGTTIGFAIRLRGQSMEYGNKLVNAMKNTDLATNFKAAYSDAPSGSDVHIFVWALTAEFWRAAPKSTPAPYTWAPTKAANEQPKAHQTIAPIPATLAPEAVTAEHKATVNMALTISCDCDKGDASAGTATGHISCLNSRDFLSMYEFPPHMAAFKGAVANLMSTTANNVPVASVHPAGLHPHDVESWSPVHSHANANGIEVHFEVAVTSVTELNTVKNIFDATDFQTNLATQLRGTTNGNDATTEWNVPNACIMKNKDPETGLPVKASWTTKHWQQATSPPTPPPTPPPLGTPGRTPNCVDGKVVVIQGHAEILSPAPVSEAKGTERLREENNFLQRVRHCMAESITAQNTTALTLEDGTERGPIAMCDILVSRGPTCNPSDESSWPALCQECYADEQVSGEASNWDIDGAAHCNGFLRYEGQIYERDAGTYDAMQANTATRRLLGKDDPNRPMQARHINDGNLTIYRFNFEINSPSADMHAANGIFSQIQYNSNAFIEDVNECMKAGHTVAPAYQDGNTYRPSVPTFSIIQADSLEYKYVHGQAPLATPTPENTNYHCQIEWSTETDCTKTCGGGESYKFGLVIMNNFTGGTSQCNDPTGASFTLTDDSQLKWVVNSNCNAGDCPTSCTTTDWSNWGSCSETCGGGDETRSRNLTGAAITLFDADTGDCTAAAGECDGVCGDMEQTRKCNNFPCPQNCVVTAWGEWGTCTKQCAEPGEPKGQQWRRRSIESQAYYGGDDCGNLTEVQECNDNPCPINCVVSQWSEWGTCDKSCAGRAAGTRLHGAKQERTRYIVRAAENGGHECPALVQTKLCALHPCGAHVCTTTNGFPLTCTYENNIVYTHHVNDVHDDELFMCYHNYVTQVCTCLCWAKASLTLGDCHNPEGTSSSLTTTCELDNGTPRGLITEAACTSASSATSLACHWVGAVHRHSLTGTGNVNDLSGTYPTV